MKTFEEFRFSIPHNKVKLGYKYSPKSKKELRKAIEAEIEIQGPEADLNMVDTSLITDMSHLFNARRCDYAKYFNGDISKWDVSNVTNMLSMFAKCEKFNSDISRWDVRKVKTMPLMFYNCTNFNQDLSNWDVSNVILWASIFDGCPISKEYKPKFK